MSVVEEYRKSFDIKKKSLQLVSNIFNISVAKSFQQKKELFQLERNFFNLCEICNSLNIKFPDKKRNFFLVAEKKFCGYMSCGNIDSSYEIISANTQDKYLNIRDVLTNPSQFIGDNLSFSFFVGKNQIETLDLESFYKKNDQFYLKEIDENFIRQWKLYFIKYCITLFLFKKENYRMALMNSAKRHLEDELEILGLDLNRFKQSQITNELAILSGGLI